MTRKEPPHRLSRSHLIAGVVGISVGAVTTGANVLWSRRPAATAPTTEAPTTEAPATEAPGENELENVKRLMWVATGVILLFAVILVTLTLTHSLGPGGVFIATMVVINFIVFGVRLGRFRRGMKRGSMYPIDWTSAAVSPERSVFIGAMLLAIFAIVSAAWQRIFEGDPPPLPSSVELIVFGAFFGLPLVEVFGSKARAWRLLRKNIDPD